MKKNERYVVKPLAEKEQVEIVGASVTRWGKTKIMNKTGKILPIVGLFIIATIPFDKFSSAEFIIKSIIVLLIIIISIYLSCHNHNRK